MLSLISLIVVIALSLLVTKVAATSLEHTGLSRQSAKFQARSAFTGVGFTTNEAEKVVNHPVRRRIILTLMLLGNAGIITAVASLMLTLWNSDDTTLDVKYRIMILFGALLLLWLISQSKSFDKVLNRLINYALKKYTRLNVRDYSNLLQLSRGYGISELLIESTDWLNGKTLLEADLKGEGVNVLAVKRKNREFVGVPQGTTEIIEGDTLILYGKSEDIARLDTRKASVHGQIEHREQLARAKKEAEERQKRKQEEEARKTTEKEEKAPVAQDK
ncbi:MAG: TrkA C-terminal domain-containing protein [Cyclobacteriaceae bacterium]